MKDLIFKIADKNTLISSPAGAGKTRILTDLFIEYIKRGVSISEIVATTYTNKAASEIKERIISSLFKENKQEKELLKEYFSGAKKIRASTIHSFLNDLLEVIFPAFAISGNRLSPKMSERIFRQIAATCVRKHHYHHISNREEKSTAVSDPRPQMCGIVFEIASEKDIVNLLCSLYQKSPLSFFWAHEIKKLSMEEAKHRFKSEELFNVYKDISILFEDVFYEFLLWKLQRGYFEFHDIEFFAYLMVSIEKSDGESSIVADWRDLLLYFNESFKVVLIDEFQDTSKHQWKIIEFLVGERFAGVGLSETSRAFVCVIGDPKQSIYSFRNADVSVMQKVDKVFEYLESKNPDLYVKVRLTKNKRSKKPIVDFVNNTFSKLMNVSSDGKPLWVTCYEPFEDERGSLHSQVASVFHEGEPFSKNKERASWEARFIASEIKKLIEKDTVIEDKDGKIRKLTYSDIVILLRAKTHSVEYEKELSREGIPFVTVDGKHETNRVFQFLKDFFIASSKPYENGYLLKMLAAFGYEYRDPYGKGIFSLSTAESQQLRVIYKAFSEYHQAFEQSPFEAFMRVISILKPIFMGLSTETDVVIALRALEEMFALAEEEGICTPFEMAEFIEKILADGSLEVNPETNAVSLMSIHKSKGLEFPVVFAASLWAERSGDKNLVMYPGDHDSLCEIAFTLPFRGRKDSKDKNSIPEALKEMDEYLERKKDEYREFGKEEVKRLFYVAFTRARDYLCVMLPTPKNSKGKENKSPYQELYDVIKGFDLEGLRKINFNRNLEDFSETLKEPLNLKQTFSKTSYVFPFKFEFEKTELPLVKKNPPISSKARKDLDEAAGLRIGTVIHDILYELKNGLLKVEEINIRVKELFRYHFGNEDRAYETAMLLNSFLNSHTGKELLEVCGKPEFSILALEKGGYRIMRIDLLIEDDDKLRVVDYKTDFQIGDSYRDQISAYIQAASHLYPEKKVTGEIVSIRTGEKINISDVSGDV